MTRIEKLEELARAVDAWCKAKCSNPWPTHMGHRDDHCLGDNHLEECPVELARQDVIEASKELQRP